MNFPKLFMNFPKIIYDFSKVIFKSFIIKNEKIINKISFKLEMKKIIKI